MKILSIPDVHGVTSRWNKPNLLRKDWDKIVFTGDYTDVVRGHEVDDEEMIRNLELIILYKRSNPNKVELLLGNHDIQYFFRDGEKFSCSRYNPSIRRELHNMFFANRRLFSIAFQEDNFLWTHAGVTAGWIKENAEAMTSCGFLPGTNNYAGALNNMMNTRYNDLLHAVSAYRGGSAKWGGPTWADKMETEQSMIDGIRQIVGHTPVEDLKFKGGNRGGIVYTDCLGESDKYLVVDTKAHISTSWVMGPMYEAAPTHGYGVYEPTELTEPTQPETENPYSPYQSPPLPPISTNLYWSSTGLSGLDSDR